MYYLLERKNVLASDKKEDLLCGGLLSFFFVFDKYLSGGII